MAKLAGVAKARFLARMGKKPKKAGSAKKPKAAPFAKRRGK